MKNTERKTLIFTLLVCCSLLLLLYGPSPALFASESNCLDCETIEHNHEHHEINDERGLENYIGISCGNEFDEGIDEIPTKYASVESYIGFGCSYDNCDGPGRENGYTLGSITLGCRNWMQMPLYEFYGWSYNYCIDEATLSPLSPTERATFIANVDAAAAIWNGAQMHDGTSTIIKLNKVPSWYGNLTVCQVKYNPNLNGANGTYYPFAHYIDLKYFGMSTIIHEFGHMLGLQDLDLFSDNWIHASSIMGYAYSGNEPNYPDIQGIAVANGKHKHHDFTRYYISGGKYKYVCFYCDLTDTRNTPIHGGSHLVNASTCTHDYEPLVSAGDRHWLKCTKCYKVIENDLMPINIRNYSERDYKVS